MYHTFDGDGICRSCIVRAVWSLRDAITKCGNNLTEIGGDYYVAAPPLKAVVTSDLKDASIPINRCGGPKEDCTKEMFDPANKECLECEADALSALGIV